MAFEPVPLAIGNNEAKHSADVLRTAVYASTHGSEGVVRKGDLEVTALPVPGGAVQIAPGAGLIRNSYPGGAGQTYSCRAGTTTEIVVPATGSGGGATRYVIVRIDDPQYDGNASGELGPYVYPELVSSVSGLDYPFIELAKIVQPANTATITNAMITKTARIAQPQTKPELLTYPVTAGGAVTLTNAAAYPLGGQTFPVETETAWGQLEIPDWATHAQIVMTWSGVRAPGGNTWGYMWVQVAPTVNPDNVKTQGVYYDTTGVSQASRLTVQVADEIAIPAALRGTSQKFYPRANVLGYSAASARLQLDGGSNLSLQILFREK
jgi:hypothetical protein